jgi:hypothetical protein
VAISQRRASKVCIERITKSSASYASAFGFNVVPQEGAGSFRGNACVTLIFRDRVGCPLEWDRTKRDGSFETIWLKEVDLSYPVFGSTHQSIALLTMLHLVEGVPECCSRTMSLL